MSGRILVIDDVAINRIMLEVRLSQLSYQVALHGSIGEIREAAPVDAVIVAGRCLAGAPAAMLADLRGRLGQPHVPVMAILAETGPLSVADALAAGADDAIQSGGNPAEMVARLRGLTRRACFEAEGSLPSGWHWGLATGAAKTAPVLVVGATRAVAQDYASALTGGWEGRIIARAWTEAAEPFGTGTPPEVVVLCASDEHPFPAAHTLIELRSGRRTNTAAVLGVFDGALEKQALELLNMGADDLYLGATDPREIGLRIGGLMARQARLRAQQTALRQGYAESLTDPLTGLQNRRGALPALARASERARRNGGALALLVADLDHFKRINDSYGHAAGDTALIEISRRLHAAIPDAPVLARMGGEEFLIAVEVNDITDATAMAEEMRHAIASVPVALGADAPEVALTISVGVQLFRDGLSGMERALTEADSALYLAKNNGRNQVSCSSVNAA
ncbi:GGDEF domain-containing protein [Donghicola sp. C2-DW-16]|uniref:diguanylate cyclase n=1 Tax=Donghicola mangrovi TaxID=2729614 RepID=A0ABX2PJY6_9RHOB|nr:GGDEF domain-containing protein [Donghicola mangrovi]NVO29027.1 GGDEF domain-containing protein [Donghicola mangrovi]